MTRSRPITFAAAAVIQRVVLTGAACRGCGGAATTAAVLPPETSSGGRRRHQERVRDRLAASAGEGKPTPVSGLTASRLGTASCSGGGCQLSHGGHPVYLDVGDKKPGDLTREGVTGLIGAAWYALTPAGNQTSAQPAGSSGGARRPLWILAPRDLAGPPPVTGSAMVSRKFKPTLVRWSRIVS